MTSTKLGVFDFWRKKAIYWIVIINVGAYICNVTKYIFVILGQNFNKLSICCVCVGNSLLGSIGLFIDKKIRYFVLLLEILSAAFLLVNLISVNFVFKIVFTFFFVQLSNSSMNVLHSVRTWNIKTRWYVSPIAVINKKNGMSACKKFPTFFF